MELHRKKDIAKRPNTELNRADLARIPRAYPIRNEMPSCRIPDDCIDQKRYPLFMARDVLKALVQSIASSGRA